MVNRMKKKHSWLYGACNLWDYSEYFNRRLWQREFKQVTSQLDENCRLEARQALPLEWGEQERRLLDKVRETGRAASHRPCGDGTWVISLSDMGSPGRFWAGKRCNLIDVLQRPLWASGWMFCRSSRVGQEIQWADFWNPLWLVLYVNLQGGIMKKPIKVS